MKIMMLLMYPLYGSGSGTFVRKLAEKLVKNYPDDKVAIFCPDSKAKMPGIKVYKFDMPFSAVATGHPDWPQAKLYSNFTGQEADTMYQKTFAQVNAAIKDFKPDVIHVHHAFYFTWIADYIRALYGTYFIVTTHGTELLSASENKMWIPLTRDALRRAWMINAVSGDTKKWLCKVYGHKGLTTKTKVITGGVDIESFPVDAPIKIINKKYKLGDKKVVVFAGKLTYKKGVEYLVKAASKIKAEIFIIGDGEEKKKLEDLANELDVNNVHFLGHFGEKQAQEFKEFYLRADVFVFPSIWDEPLGLVALEAMACKTPVVASNKGGIPLAVKDGYNGYLVRARSFKAISKKVSYLLKNDDLRIKMGEQARKTVEDKFDWENIAKKFHRHYTDAFSASKKRLKRMKLPIDIEREYNEIKTNKIDYI